ncbi:MAG: hypothetical protein ACRCXM_02845, partial [Beijerinckiaceae bacterium]
MGQGFCPLAIRLPSRRHGQSLVDTMIRLRNLFLALCLVTALPGWGVLSLAHAQVSAPAPSPETAEARVLLDGLKSSFDQIEASLARPLNDGALVDSRTRLSDLLAQTRKLIDEQSPRVDALRLRLE